LTMLLRCVLVCAVFVACAPLNEPETPANSPSKSASAPEGAAGWKIVAPKDGGFAVTMPKTAEEKVVAIKGTAVHLWVAKENGIAYLVSYYDIPPKDQDSPENTLKAEALGYFGGCKGTLERQQLVEGARQPTLRVMGACKNGEPVLGSVV